MKTIQNELVFTFKRGDGKNQLQSTTPVDYQMVTVESLTETAA